MTTWVDYESGLLRFDDAVEQRKVPREVEINVKSKGAVADGVTDNAPAFAAAHDELPPWGGTIIIPAAPYAYVVDSLTTFSKSNVTLLIEDGAHIKVNPAAAGTIECFLFQNGSPGSYDDLTADPSANDVVITVTTPGNFNAGDWVHIKDNDQGELASPPHGEINRVRSKSGSDLTLEYPLTDDYVTLTAVKPSVAVLDPILNSGMIGGGKIQGGNESDATVGNAGVRFKHAVGAFCRDLEFMYCRTDSIRVFDCLMAEITNTYCHDTSQFDGNGRGITITRSQHCLVANNRIQRTRHHVDVSTFARHVLVQNNECHGSAEAGMLTHPDCKYIWFVDNNLDGGHGHTGASVPEWGTVATATGMLTREACTHILLEGNTITNHKASGIWIYGDRCDEIIVRDNTIINCNLQGESNTMGGIKAVQESTTWTPGEGLLFEGNTILETAGRGITIGISKCTVRKNYIKRITTQGNTAGILVRPYTSSGTPAAVDSVVVEGNTIEDVNAGYGIRIGHSSSYLVTHCDVRRNTIKRVKDSGIYAIPSQVDNLRIERNDIFEPNLDDGSSEAGITCGASGNSDVASVDLRIRHNNIYLNNQSDTGILCNVASAIIEANFVDDAQLIGINIVAGASGQDTLGLKLLRNVVTNCGNDGIRIGSSVNGTQTDVLIAHNVLINNGAYGIRVRATATDTVLVGNIPVGNTSGKIFDDSSTGIRIITEMDIDTLYRYYIKELQVQGNVGFHGTIPVAQSTGWAESNVTTDKTFDANSITLHELADVVGTLVAFMKTRGDLST